MEHTKRYINYKCVNILYHINFNREVYTKNVINVSKYIPTIIKRLIMSIPNKFNRNYIICPYYRQYYDYQLGITETIKQGETINDAINRGVNEETGIANFNWYNKIEFTKLRKWTGVLVKNERYDFNPNSIHNIQPDSEDKVAIILYDNLYTIIKKFENIKVGDINSDGIQGLGLLSVYDCKRIIT
jgi:hypothetical protein